MAKCDLCGASCTAQELATLMDQYQAADVRDLCPACRRWADKTKSDMIGEIAGRMREAVAAKKGKPPAPWWRRGLQAIGGLKSNAKATRRP